VALGGKSETRTLQRIGRLARPYPGKDVANAFDTWDSAEFLYKQGEPGRSCMKTSLTGE